MRGSSLHYFPIPVPYLFVFALFVAVLVVLIEIRVLRYAFEAVGVEPRYVFLVLVLSLLGSYVNIPVAELPAERIVSGQIVRFFGMPYVVPQVELWPRTIIAVNVGGGLIPVILSIYLVMKRRFFAHAALATLLVAAIVHHLAYPVQGVGIAVPFFLPALAAVLAALLFGRREAAPLAYVAGCMGTLIGGDLLNLGAVRGLGAPVASIGGAGTFDGVFMTGILAVLLAAWPFGAPPASEPDAEDANAGPEPDGSPP